jgi:hypothetical protein
MKRAAFFFGAGISKPSGRPLAREITRSGLEDQWHLTTDRRFLPGLNQNRHSVRCLVDSVTPTVQKFLARLKDIASDYITELSRSSRPRDAHYEDLFSLSEQAFRSESDHIPNLVVVEFRRRLRSETQPLYADFEGGSSGGVGLAGLAETACDFLHWVVHHKLRTCGTPRAGLQVITDAAKQSMNWTFSL